MNGWQARVHEFHEATNSAIGTDPELARNELRAKLIMEEAVETVAAMGFQANGEIIDPTAPVEGGKPKIVAEFSKEFDRPNFPEVVDGLCDLIYVILGAAVTAGIDLDPHFQAVHEANMMKLQGPKRADGKQLKPEGWKPPDHEAILIRQARENERWKELEAKVFGE